MDMNNFDPVYHAWTLNKSPNYSYPSSYGKCGRCGNMLEVYSIKYVLSRNFTDWDTVNPESNGLCSPCVFSFKKENIMLYPFLITKKHANYANSGVIKKLLSKPLNNVASLTFPISHKKHLLPKAKYGYIVSDKGLFTWGASESEMFNKIIWLKSLGVKEKDLDNQSPPVDIVMNHKHIIEELFPIWEQVNKWVKTPQFEIAVIASRDDKQEEA